MLKLYRCTADECSTDPHGRLIFDFTAEAPICPKCGADGRLPEFAWTVVELTRIHFLVKDKAGPIVDRGARRRLACDPSPGTKKTGERCAGTLYHAATNCPDCRASADFPADSAVKIHPEGDFPIEIDPKKQTITTPKPGGCGCG